MYYHIIEDHGYGNIGCRGYFETKEEADKEIKRLEDYFPKIYFYLYPSPSKREPVIVTI